MTAVTARPWGYIDEAGGWRPIPVQPLHLGGFADAVPPFDVTLPDGRVRRIVYQPLQVPEAPRTDYSTITDTRRGVPLNGLPGCGTGRRILPSRVPT